MIPILEPLEAGLLVALISKFVINNPRFWECVGCSTPTVHREHEQEDSSSNTTSVNDAEMVHIHHFDTVIHT